MRFYRSMGRLPLHPHRDRCAPSASSIDRTPRHILDRLELVNTADLDRHSYLFLTHAPILCTHATQALRSCKYSRVSPSIVMVWIRIRDLGAYRCSLIIIYRKPGACIPCRSCIHLLKSTCGFRSPPSVQARDSNALLGPFSWLRDVAAGYC